MLDLKYHMREALVLMVLLVFGAGAMDDLKRRISRLSNCDMLTIGCAGVVDFSRTFSTQRANTIFEKSQVCLMDLVAIVSHGCSYGQKRS